MGKTPAATTPTPGPTPQPYPFHTVFRRFENYLRKKYLVLSRKQMLLFGALVAAIAGVGVWELARAAVANAISSSAAKQATDKILQLEERAQSALRTLDRRSNAPELGFKRGSEAIEFQDGKASGWTVKQLDQAGWYSFAKVIEMPDLGFPERPLVNVTVGFGPAALRSVGPVLVTTNNFSAYFEAMNPPKQFQVNWVAMGELRPSP